LEEERVAPAAMEPALRSQVLAVVDDHRSTAARVFADVATGCLQLMAPAHAAVTAGLERHLIRQSRYRPSVATCHEAGYDREPIQPDHAPDPPRGVG
jgi:hypothetical protein